MSAVPTYNSELYRHSTLVAKARSTADAILKVTREVGAEAVVVTGKSGIAMGFAALVFASYRLVTVRKDNENSHGSPIEAGEYGFLHSYIILDDFVDSGATVDRVIQRLNTDANNDRRAHPKCLGVLCYGRQNSIPIQYMFKSGSINMYGVP